MLAKAQTVANENEPLVRLIAAGDHRTAVAECAALYGAALGRLCMAFLGSQEDAEEVVQETLLAAHRAMPGFRADGSVRAWLFGIARRQCARFLERGRKHQHLRLVGEQAADGDTGDAVRTRRRAERVRSALSGLKPSERDPLVLRYQGELSYREIAEICGIDEAVARKRVSRGLERLRQTLTPEAVE